MIGLVLMAAVAASNAPPVVTDGPSLQMISQAIAAGRSGEAKLMIARAIAAGDHGEAIDRLIADLDFATGRDGEALARYSVLATAHPDQQLLCERILITALRTDDPDHARRSADCATADGAGWRAWNARGALADMMDDWQDADRSYAAALKLSPGQAEVLNNLGFSLLLRGRWSEAEEWLDQARTSDPQSTRIANNLELARAAMAQDLPRQRPGENGEAWAARLNDAGIVALIGGDKGRATSAFTQALEVSDTWYARASNNLDQIGRP